MVIPKEQFSMFCNVLNINSIQCIHFKKQESFYDNFDTICNIAWKHKQYKNSVEFIGKSAVIKYNQLSKKEVLLTGNRTSIIYHNNVSNNS